MPSSREVICASAVETFGQDLQMLKLREEIAELQVAMARYELRREDVGSVIEEVADVTIMVAQARLIFGPEAVDAIIDQKLERLLGTIAAARANKWPS